MKLVNLVIFIIFTSVIANLYADDVFSVKDTNVNFGLKNIKKGKNRGINWYPHKDIKNFNKYLGIAVGVTLYFVVGNYATGKLNAN